jgi:hypothetical protein
MAKIERRLNVFSLKKKVFLGKKAQNKGAKSNSPNLDPLLFPSDPDLDPKYNLSSTIIQSIIILNVKSFRYERNKTINVVYRWHLV